MEFTVLGQGDPLLHVHVEHGEKLKCESDAMVSMEANLELKGEMRGGLLAAIGRKIANGESFFTQSIEGVYGAGDTLLAPELPGDIRILECGGNIQYRLNDGVFLASESTVDVQVEMQRLSTALLGGSGGFFIGRTTGYGKLAVSGFGTVFELEVTPEAPVIVDNYHVVAWDHTLHHEISVSTKKSSGLLGNIVNSMVSGEGIVTKFTGRGKVLVCSRNRGAFLSWIAAKIAPPPRNS